MTTETRSISNSGSGARRVRFSHLGELAHGTDSVITRLMADKLARPQILSLAAGFTDNRVLPGDLVSEATRELAGRNDNAHLQYGMNRGRPGLRCEVASLLKSYPGESSVDIDEDEVLITNGSQQALYILVQMTCNPGDIVLVESPTYFVFLELLAGLGVQAVPMPMNAAGEVDMDGLRDLIDRMTDSGDWDRVGLVYLMGAYANPSTRCISEEEKTALARVMGSLPRPVPVIEDMAYRELYFDTPNPARSLLANEAWDGYPVFYLGTFTKPFATGLKTGFVVSRESECLKAVSTFKGHQDFGSAHYNQAILEWVLETGAYTEHLESIRKHYRDKRDLLESALTGNGLREAGWSWESPRGGLLLWAKANAEADTRLGSPFYQACLEREILYVPGDLCFAGKAPTHYVRLSFGAIESELIAEAAKRFCEAATA